MLETFLGLVFLGLWGAGAWIISTALARLRLAIQSRNWIRTEATVDDYRVETDQSRLQVGRTYYGFTVLCTYWVQGLPYQFRGFGQSEFKSRTEAEQAASRSYPISQSVTVFYDPKEPAQSTCSPGWDSEAFTGTLIGFGILSLGTGLLLILILPAFEISSEVAIVTVLPLLKVLPLMIVLALCYYGLSRITVAIRSLRSQRPERRIGWRSNLAVGVLLTVVALGILSVVLLDAAGEWVIGSKPDVGCYRPDFGQKRWVAVPCPSLRNPSGAQL